MPYLGGSRYPVLNSGSRGATAVPVNTVLPAITGTKTIGQTLTCSTGTWTNSPTSYAYEWRRNGVAISGATSNSYLIAQTDGYLSCYVTPTNAAGAGSTKRATTGVKRQLFLCGDSLTAPAGYGTAVQAAMDAQFGAVWQVLNVANSGHNVSQMETRAQNAVDPVVDKDWGCVYFHEYANQVVGIQGATSGAGTAALLYSFGEARAAARGLPIFATAPYSGVYGTKDGTQAHIASELIRANYAAHGGVGLVDLDDATILADIDANDDVHWTSAVYALCGTKTVNGILAAGLIGDCGGIFIHSLSGTTLRIHSNAGYFLDASKDLPTTLSGTYLVITGGTGFTKGAYLLAGPLTAFSTPDYGLKNLYQINGTAAGAASISGGTYQLAGAAIRNQVTTVVTAADTAGNKNSTYFRIYDAAGSVDVYLTNGTGVAPVGANRTIAVTYTNGDTAITLATLIAAAMNTDGAWWVRRTNSTLYIADIASGVRTNASAQTSGATVATPQSGL